MLYNINSDISALTTIPLKTLCKLSNIAVKCICNDIYESQLEEDAVTSIDVGIGKLNIIVSKDNVNYTFVPSKELESEILNTLETKDSPLVESVEQSITSRIINTYKDLI